MNPIIDTTTVCRTCNIGAPIRPEYQQLVDAIAQEALDHATLMMDNIEPPDERQQHLIAHQLLNLYCTYIDTDRGIRFLQIAKEFDPQI